MMQNYIALLRGINVSGQKKINMAELRQHLAAYGWQNLQTYIQSGNIVFQTAETHPLKLASRIKSSITEHYGFEVPVMVMSAMDLKTIINANPFADQDSGKLYVTFLWEEPKKQLVRALPISVNPAEAFKVASKAIYVFCPDGYGRTKINNTFFEKKLQLIATTRNWKTCLKLLDLAK